MTTRITFLVDSTKLGAGGTIANPSSVPMAALGEGNNHPRMILQQDGGKPVNQSGDTQVNIAGDEQVIISVADTNYSLATRLAPYALIVHNFNGKGLTDEIMGTAKSRPINIPEFDEERADMPYMDYADGDNPKWGTVPPSYSTWQGSPMIAQPLVPSIAALYGPYVQFKGSSLVTGPMDYGLVFGASSDGKTVGYFYFDPTLGINMPR